jgi:hypothetical protein
MLRGMRWSIRREEKSCREKVGWFKGFCEEDCGEEVGWGKRLCFILLEIRVQGALKARTGHKLQVTGR